MYIINTLAPVFLVIAVGVGLRKAGFFSSEFVSSLNRLVYWVGLPCLLFYKTAGATYDYAAAGNTFLVVLAGTVGCIAAGYIAAFLMRLRGMNAGALVQGTFRGNLVYVGLSVIIYSFSNSSGFDAAKMETIAVVVLALMIPIYNISAVVILLAGQHRLDRYVPGKILGQIITNPLILACVSGIIYSAIFSQLPMAVDRFCSAIGQMSLPLALLSIGATLAEGKISSRLIPALTASVIKLAVAPLVGLLVASLLSLGAGEMRIALILLACPTAVASYVMADQFGTAGRLAATIVVLTTILSMLSLGIVVGLF